MLNLRKNTKTEKFISLLQANPNELVDYLTIFEKCLEGGKVKFMKATRKVGNNLDIIEQKKFSRLLSKLRERGSLEIGQISCRPNQGYVWNE